MEVMAKLAAVGVTAVVLSAVLKKNTPELALLLVLAAGLWMLTLDYRRPCWNQWLRRWPCQF